MANGIIIIDKPAGWTSMDVCAKLRGILKTKKVGHAGTLDPMATGVLPVFVGQATRAVSFAEDGEKEYIAGLRLGRTTDTQDISGETLDTHPVLTGREDLLHLLPRFTGVYELELLDQTGPGDYTLRIRCSKGTYVRTLCHDIGQALGCGGCMSSLRRTVAAGFTLEEAVTLDRVQEEGEALLAPLDSLFRQHPAYRIRQPRVDALCRNGNPFTVRQELPEGVYRVYGQSGEFLCLSRLEGGVMTSLKNFFGA